MLKISWVTASDSVHHCLIDDLKCLSSLLSILERDKQVRQFKIEQFGYVVKDLYREFGYGSCDKFVIAFTFDSG